MCPLQCLNAELPSERTRPLAWSARVFPLHSLLELGARFVPGIVGLTTERRKWCASKIWEMHMQMRSENRRVPAVPHHSEVKTSEGCDICHKLPS